MNNLLNYLNPIRRLGFRKYSLIFPLVTMISLCICGEFITYQVLSNPEDIGIYAVVLFLFFIIYFSFRDGIRGGMLSVTVTILYYIYIIFSHHYVNEQLRASLQTTGVLAAIYLFLALIIGWLKETIDKLIERETDEKRRLLRIVQQLPVGVIITDKNGIIETVNKRVDKILGLNIPVGYSLGINSAELKNNSNALLSINLLLAEVVNEGKSTVTKETVIKYKKGKSKYIDITASAVYNKSGKIIAIALILNDVTQQKELEQRKDDFVNMASHELKTPVTSMKLYIEFLKTHMQKYKNTNILSIIEKIKYQTERLQKIVNDLLDVSRLETGKFSIQKEVFDLENLINNTVDELRILFPQKEFTFTPKKSLYINGDKFRLYQVITNLTTNAIKYSPTNTNITLSLIKKKNYVIVSVRDFGIGISAHQQKKIFERLYQVKEDKEKTFPGFGMGLYIAKEIIKKHKGSIWVKSEKGKGSTFYFSVPISIK